MIVVGEIRDKLTAGIAIEAALTGHKVFATFHTEDSIGSLILTARHGHRDIPHLVHRRLRGRAAPGAPHLFLTARP